MSNVLTLKDYKGFPYIEYNLGNGEKVSSIDYFTFKTKSEKYHDIVDNVGGFVANLTRREQETCDFDRITFMCIPDGSPKFKYHILYYKGDTLLQNYHYSDPYAFIHFYKRFKDCIIDEGKYPDIHDIPVFKNLEGTEPRGFALIEPGKPAKKYFNFFVNDEPFPVGADETLITDDLSVFADRIQDSPRIKYAVFNLDVLPTYGVCYDFCFLDENEKPLTNEEIYNILEVKEKGNDKVYMSIISLTAPTRLKNLTCYGSPFEYILEGNIPDDKEEELL